MNCSAFMRVSEGKPTWSNLAYDRVDATLKKKKQHPRRMPFTTREDVSWQLRKMQEMKVIQPSHSPRTSPVVFVRKHDRTNQFCIDYRDN